MRRKNQTTDFIKENIGIALVKLMKKYDYNNITITQICDNSGYGRTTFYRHFSNNKDNILLFLASKKWLDYKINHKKDIENDESRALLEHIYNNKDFFLLLKKHNLLYLTYLMFIEISNVHKEEIYRYPKAFFAGGYYGVIHEWILDNCIYTPEEILKKITDGILISIDKNK